jgi:hypothetical protein
MRIAKFILAEYRECGRDGVVGDWTTLPNAKVLDITLRDGGEHNTADIDISDTRWNATRGVSWGYQVRLRYSSTVLFQGFITNFKSGYSSAVATDPQSPPSAKEGVQIHCKDYRWLYNRCSPVNGQVARGIDDYNNDEKLDSATFMSGRRCVFNPSGMFNMDPDIVTFGEGWGAFEDSFASYVFGNASKTGTPWTAGAAINFLLSPLCNQIPALLSIDNPLDLPGLTHADFSTILNNILVNNLNVVDAVSLICDNIGWTFREQYTMDGPLWVFYKSGMATGTTRVYIESGYNPCVLHSLHAPAVGEDIDKAIQTDGKKMVMALDLTEDIDPVINQPWGLGAPHQFEITAELVPAWEDADLHIAAAVADLYKTESELQDESDPDSFDFYKYHHALGSDFLRDVGRKFALNESGKYTDDETYDRGALFDFTTVGIPTGYLVSGGKKLYGPFNRRFLPCLTFDKDSVNSVGIRLQWSCDAGTTWQELDCPVEILEGEAAVRLMIPNLAEIVDKKKGLIAAGDYAGTEINFFTALADDIHNARVFKTGGWNTRVRITATVEMDQRNGHKNDTVYAGSPYVQAKCFDFADRYTLQKRCSSSTYYGGDLPTWDTDESDKLLAQMELIRKANEDMAIHGQVVLDRLWIDGTNPPTFALGDGITGFTGRDYPLGQTLGSRTVYPELVQIQYLVQSQKMILLLRDPRLSIQTRDSTHKRGRRE